MIKPIQVDILIPSCNGYNDIVALVAKLKKQKHIKIKNIVVPITLIDPNNDEKLKQFCLENNIINFEVDKDFYSHSLTRQRAIKKYCTSDIVIMFSQDVVLINNMAFYNLVKDIANGECVYSYGRQICPKRSIEKYIRDKNYPAYSYYVDKEDIPEMQIMAFFASDAFAAIDRNVFIKIDGYRDYDVMMGEDMLYSYFILEEGYRKKYCADAVVVHWHRYTLKQLYRRYYQIGKFYEQVKLFDGYKSSESGYKLAMYVWKKCWKHLYVRGIIRWLPDMACRYFGMKNGRGIKKKK